ncbi:hypothetical protein Tco_0289306 [Tanacetum coccineum]
MGYVDDSEMPMYCGGRGGSVGSNFEVGERKVEFIRRIGGGSFAKRSMVARDGLGGVQVLLGSKKCHSPSLIGPIPKEECHVVERKARVKKKIALVFLTKEAQMSHQGNDMLAILRCPQIDQTAIIEAQMIEEMIG